MLVAVKMTMIAFAAFVVETDDAPTILAKKQSIVEEVRATGSRTFHTTIAPSGKTVFEHSTSTAAIMLSFTPSQHAVVKDANAASRLIWQQVPGCLCLEYFTDLSSLNTYIIIFILDERNELPALT
ncbi:hypothetical protein LC653_45400 [Nostoc sp. CHAB 5784]|nr:hypothetical protein [Nostoc mirabile CHAB5784]MCC5670802.1 hypothetical protein [Nostoc mirabile CHAB5784]